MKQARRQRESGFAPVVEESVDLSVTDLRMPVQKMAPSIPARLIWFRRLLRGTATMALLPSCVSDPPRIPAAMDPSNPNAPESSPVSMLSSVDPAVATPTESTPKPDAGAVYTCPMHPEVIRPAPGRCPICGMTLVLRKSVPPPPPAPPSAPHQHGTRLPDAGLP